MKPQMREKDVLPISEALPNSQPRGAVVRRRIGDGDEF